MAELKKILLDLYARIQAKQEKRQTMLKTLANAFLPEPESADNLRNVLNNNVSVNSEILRDLLSIINFIGSLDEQSQSNRDVVWATSIVTKERDLFEVLKTKFFSKYIPLHGDMAEVGKILGLREIVESVKKLNVLVGNVAVLSKLRVKFEKESESEKYLLSDILNASRKAA